MDETWQSIMDFLARESRLAYRSLMDTPGIETFFMEATPFDAIRHSRMGSRPSARSGQTHLRDLRAIPWVFSWNQARFYLPGWFGAGTALERLRVEKPEWFQLLSTDFQTQSFVRYLIFNLESSLESSDTSIFTEYASLVQDEALRQNFLERILEEHRRTFEGLKHLLKEPMKIRRPRFYRTLHARDVGLRRLHHRQIHLLREWRKTLDDNLLTELLVVVNGIASGQRTTG